MAAEIIIGIVLALVIGLLFVVVNPRRPASLGATWPFLLLLVLWTVAIGVWVEPIGPSFYGVSFAPFALAALAFVLLFAALPPRPGAITSEGAAAEEAVAFTIVAGVFFWAFAFLLLGSIALAIVI